MSIALKAYAEPAVEGETRESVARFVPSESLRRAMTNLEHRIGRTYRFESAHHLPLVPDGHKCKNMHGHNYRVHIVMRGELDSRGFIKDFAEIDEQILPLISRSTITSLTTLRALKIRRLKISQLGFLNASPAARKSVFTRTMIVGLK